MKSLQVNFWQNVRLQNSIEKKVNFFTRIFHNHQNILWMKTFQVDN